MERFVGIDWSQNTHEVEIQATDGEVIETGTYGTELEDLHRLRDRFVEYAQEVDLFKIGIEDPTRPIVRLLLEADLAVYVISPRQTDAIRPVYSQAGSKDDPLDAHIVCEELRVHPEAFYKLESREPLINRLSYVYRSLQKTKQDRSRLTERLRADLRRYRPEFLELDWEVSSRVMLELIEVIPDAQTAEQISEQKLQEALGRCRKHSCQEVRQILGQPGLSFSSEFLETFASIAGYWKKQLQIVQRMHEQCLDEITELLDEISECQKQGKLPSASKHGSSQASTDSPEDNQSSSYSDVEIAMSVDGIGMQITAGLFAEGFEAIVSEDRELLRRQSIAPVTKKSGKDGKRDGPPPRVHQRHARNGYLTNNLHKLGDSLQRKSPHYRRKYEGMRKRDHTHGRACRQVADQFLGVFFAMLRDRTVYDPTLHGATRR